MFCVFTLSFYKPFCGNHVPYLPCQIGSRPALSPNGQTYPYKPFEIPLKKAFWPLFIDTTLPDQATYRRTLISAVIRLLAFNLFLLWIWRILYFFLPLRFGVVFQENLRLPFSSTVSHFAAATVPWTMKQTGLIDHGRAVSLCQCAINYVPSRTPACPWFFPNSIPLFLYMVARWHRRLISFCCNFTGGLARKTL